MTSSGEVTTHNDDHNPRTYRVGMINSHHRPVPVQGDIFDLRRILVTVALSVGAFGIGATEFVTMNLLPYVANAFGHDEDATGCMTSMYALGVVVGAPLITVLTGSAPHRRMLPPLMAAFTIDNDVTVWAGTLGFFETVMVSRLIVGLPHGAYFSVMGLVVVSLAKPGRRDRVVALSGAGLSVVTVIGVPTAQALGQIYGWRSASGFVAVIDPVALVSLWSVVPYMNRMLKTHPIDELLAPGNAQVWLTVAIDTIGFGGMFAVYTCITWTMICEVGVSENHIWVVLMAYGIGMVVGAYIGGWLPDRIGEWGIMVALALMVIMFSAFYFTSQNAVLGTINFLIIGLLGPVLVPNLQTRLTDVAGRAQTLAVALDQVALNMANAFGVAFGGWVIVSDYDYRASASGGATSAMLAISIALPIIVLYRRLQAKKAERVEPR